MARVRQPVPSRQSSLFKWTNFKGTRIDERVHKNLDSSDQTARSPSLQLLPTLTANQSFSQFVANIIKSDDKQFFIHHSPLNQSRQEWKLVQINFPSTMKLHLQCFQDGKFIVQFYIQHYNDKSVNLTDQRY
jgi:hypothetical protein